MKKTLPAFVFVCFLFLNGFAQQIKIPAPSPAQNVKQEFGLSAIELSYSRPGVKSRTVFGDLVPYGKVWRTGANQATTINFGDSVIIGGTPIPPGKYGLLTIPGPDEWTIIITKQLDVTNPSAYKADQDMVRVKVRTQAFPYPIETFTILFSNITPNSCDLAIIWDKTLVALPIKTDIDSRIMAKISAAMDKDSFPYFTAATYYLDNKKDIYKALEWFNKAVEQNPKAYYMFYQKARCQAKMGRNKEAMATAQRSMQLAKEAKNEDYVALNEKLIATLR
ncbi:MAG: DUF2911 domain-containing protein [Bacteroidota bacterium]|nr:DUF2911 domain-containing protein [Bacteroidota bacterium]MDP4248584.1 DUF2911 domain-containing protein [Bacteroidota bacterium]